MARLYLIIFSLLAVSLHGAVLIAPQDAMRQNFGNDVVVEKKNILLNRQQAVDVSQSAKTVLKSKIFRSFRAIRDGIDVGYGVLISGKVRSKNAAVLYLITPSGTLKSIEIVAFNEPPEFIPSQSWLRLFEGQSGADTLRVGKDVPTITGATMSARTVTDGARVALAVFQHAIKDKP